MGADDVVLRDGTSGGVLVTRLGFDMAADDDEPAGTAGAGVSICRTTCRGDDAESAPSLLGGDGVTVKIAACTTIDSPSQPALRCQRQGLAG